MVRPIFLRSVPLRNPRSNRTWYDKRLIFKYAIALLFSLVCFARTAQAYAERLGWNKGDRVLILHMDDADMSYDSISVSNRFSKRVPHAH